MTTADERRDGAPESAGSLLNDLLDHDLSRGVSAARTAARLWHRANGDFERRHTCGVFLKDLSARGEDPILIVYIDSNAVMQDFTTNREIYRLRLANQGFSVSDVQFKLSKYGHGSPSVGGGAATEKTVCHELPGPTEEQVAIVRDACANLPESIRGKVCEAMISSMRRQRAKRIRENKSLS